MAKDKAYPGQKHAVRITAKSVNQVFSPWRELEAGQYSVGGSLTNDIALANCSTAELFQLNIEQAAFNRSALFLVPISYGLEIDGAELAIGDRVDIEGAMTLNAPEHIFEFATPHGQQQSYSAEEPGRKLALSGRPLPGLNGVGLLTGKELSNGWQSRAKGASRLLAIAGFLLFAGFASLGTRAFLNGGQTGMSVTAMEQISSNRLSSVLTSIDLAQYLKIDEESGKARLSGTLTEEQASRLQIALAPFGTAVETRIKFKPNASHGVAGIFLKPREFVIAADGRLIGQGGLMKSGWRVATIAREGVELTKDGQMLIVPIGDGGMTTGSIRPGLIAAGKSAGTIQNGGKTRLEPMRGTLKAVD